MNAGMKNIARLVVASALLAACASPPPPKEVFYRFDPLSDAADSEQVFEGNLRVDPLRAQGILSERALLFSRSESPGKLEQYRYHHWIKPPAQLLTDGLILHLQQAGIASQVIATGIRAEVDYSVDGELLRLERVIGDDQETVAVEILLRVQRFSTRELVMQKHYLETVAVNGDNMTDVIRAMSLAQQQIYAKFVSDLLGLQ